MIGGLYFQLVMCLIVEVAWHMMLSTLLAKHLRLDTRCFYKIPLKPCKYQNGELVFAENNQGYPSTLSPYPHHPELPRHEIKDRKSVV